MPDTVLPGIDGAVAVVTGGSRGLGRSIAEALAGAGAEVVIASRKADACEQAAEEITARTGRQALGIGCHVGRWDDCDRLVETVLDRLGRIDILVNNAGMSPLYDDLASVTEDLFDKVIGVNLKGAFRLAALAGTHMCAAGRGAIINISSVGAVAPSPRELPYAAAKAGLNCLTLGLARAFAPTVRVNGIMPGAFLTDIATAWDEATVERAARRIPLRRIGEPSEIVGSVLYLASDAASYTTGAILTVDGGAALS